MHAKFDMPVMLAQFRHRIGITRAGLRVDLGRRAASRALQHPQHRTADLKFPPDPLALRPRRRPAEPDIRSESPPVPPGADLAFEVFQAGEIVEANDRGALVAEHMAGDVMKCRLP